jgi:hypothetical protein
MKAQWEWHRVNNDINGNSRFAVHFLPLVRDMQGKGWGTNSLYQLACKRANKLGGRKFHNKQFGGGIVFQAYESQLPQLENGLLALQENDA